MRLLFVHDRLGALGGAEANLMTTARELRRRGHEIALAHGAGTGLGEAEAADLFPQRFAWAPGQGDEAVAEALGEFRPDLAYVHKLSEEPALALLVASPTPVVRMVHDHDLYCMRSYKYHPLTRRTCTRGCSWRCIVPCGASLSRNREGRFGLRWISYFAKKREIAFNRQFDRLIVATEFMRQELVRNGFASERIEIHAPVPDHAPLCPTPVPSGTAKIVYAGQIIRGKGVDVLLEALALVRQPFECVILGDGSHRAACEKRSAELGLTQRVRFLGFVPQAEVAEHYRAATVAVMSSLWPEPFGATGLEALRRGVPVVAFDAGGIREWLTDGVNGFLIPWGNRRVFAARVETLLADPSLARQMGEAGRTQAHERLNFTHYIDGLEDLLRRTRDAVPLPSESLLAA